MSQKGAIRLFLFGIARLPLSHPNSLRSLQGPRLEWKLKSDHRIEQVMKQSHDHIPGVTDDPVIQLLLRGEAHTLHEAEEKYLDAAIPEILELLRGPLDNSALSRHPLLN